MRQFKSSTLTNTPGLTLTAGADMAGAHKQAWTHPHFGAHKQARTHLQTWANPQATP